MAADRPEKTPEELALEALNRAAEEVAGGADIEATAQPAGVSNPLDVMKPVIPQAANDSPAFPESPREEPAHAQRELLSAILAAVKEIGSQLAARETPPAIQQNASVGPGDAVRDVEFPQRAAAPLEPAAGLPEPVPASQPRTVTPATPAGADIESLQQVIAELQAALQRSGTQTVQVMQTVTGSLRSMIAVVRQQMDSQRQLARQVDQLGSIVASLLSGGNERQRAQRGGFGV